MRNFKLTISYDGTRYNGWQRQGNTKNTIQEKIENVLSVLFDKKIEIYGSGRTDAGTHAYAQIGNFKVDSQLDCFEIQRYLNQYLPEDIAILSVEEVSDRFHARLSATAKTYLYRLYIDEVPPVFERKYVYVYPCNLDFEKMQYAKQYLLGKHDFRGFSSEKRKKKSTVRELYSVDIDVNDKEVRFLYYGNGFLFHMVRILTGTLVAIGEGKMEPTQVLKILETKDRILAGPTFPAKGLTLQSVEYGSRKGGEEC